MVIKTVKAKYSKGKIVPLEKLDIDEGKEITITISDIFTEVKSNDPLDSTFGGWRDLLDAEKLKNNIYADRTIATRQRIKL